MKPLYAAGIVMSMLLFASCDTSDTESEGAIFAVRACQGSGVAPSGETFHVRITDPDVIEEAERLIESEEQRIISAPLRRGDGGFNEPWSWHLDPDSVEFADLTIELCDGCPHMIEEDLDYWIGTVGRYCPWSTELVARVD